MCSFYYNTLINDDEKEGKKQKGKLIKLFNITRGKKWVREMERRGGLNEEGIGCYIEKKV